MMDLHASTAAVHRGASTVIGTTLNQRFTLDKELGRGGMGAVYRATDQVLQRTVAIKVLRERTDDQVGRKLRLEAQILARLVHDNVVRLYDFGEADGIYYFVMEEVDGPSFVRRWKQVTLPERLRIIAQTAEALDYAHHQGVIHRDVKPANVLLTSTDQAKLSDFGLSLIADEAQVSGTIKGTPHYMSPEQAKGGRLDYRTDLYSLGVMMYECATGSPPFTGPTMAVMASHVNALPEPPRARNPSVSPALETLILRLLEKDPARRPHSGSEVAALARDLIAYDPSMLDPNAKPSSDPTIRVGTAPPSFPTAAPTQNDRAAPIATLASMAEPVTRAPVSIAPPPAATSATAKATAGGADRERAIGMIAEVVADPIVLSADDRYFCGHYLAYLLGGSRRRGFLRRRPLDPLNADRARLMLAMTWLMIEGPKDGAIERASALLESSFDIRPALNPIVVIKYLATRDNPNKRRAFRQARKRLQDASPVAGTRMTDDKGVLNPGLMPQVLDDLAKVSPARVEVDDQLVGRWNRVAEVWRSRPDFRQAVLGYATTSAWRDPSSGDLWPEVVYPLIERARWQRKLRSGIEAAWDNVCGALHLPDAGNTLDRAIQKVVPSHVLLKLDASLDAFEEDPQLDVDLGLGEVEASPRGSGFRVAAGSFHDLDIDLAPSHRSAVRLCSADPVRLTMGDLRDLYQEAVVALRTPGSKAGHRLVTIGPYRLAVIPSIRGKSAGQIAIQGMPNKQLEMLIPSIRLASSVGKPILAAWTYADDSLAVAYVDHKNTERYISWHAPTNQQENFDDPAALNSTLLQLGLEAPDQLGLALTKRFRPRNPV
jgi:serine/threonine-protein kinase